MQLSQKRVLMVAFQFPPFAGSSAIQRTLRFVQHLPGYGWSPLILTARASAYAQTSDDLMAAIPAGVPVHRAYALDAARHLALMGRYPAWLARPDRWASWRLDGVRVGWAMIKRYKPTLLWSTFPTPTAHVIAAALHKESGLPWVADFRDPMAQDGYPEDPKTWTHFKAIEARTLRTARYSVFTTPGAARMYRERYPDIPADRIQVIENGYDEESFAAAARGADDVGTPLNEGCVTLLHSGVVYPSERDPSALLDALAEWVRIADDSLPKVRLRFRASGQDRLLRSMAERRGIASSVECLPSLPYVQAIQEMQRADGLLVLQAANCNQQIPAKLYEYLRAGRPILGLTDPEGDTAGTLRAAGIHTIAPLGQRDRIVELLETFLRKVVCGDVPQSNSDVVQGASRHMRAKALAALLDQADRPIGR